MILRVVFSLLVVLGLMWGLAKLARRPLSGNRGGGVLSVLNRQQLGRNSSVTVVRVADRALILGVTETQVSLLGEAELDAFEAPDEPAERRRAVPLIESDTADGETDHLPPVDQLPVDQLPGRLDGSVLSRKTWSSTLDFLRERTARR
jgi:flagellar protein FliO/FliZ